MGKKTLLQVCTDALGTDASPSDEAPDELGCANSVTELLRKVYPETPKINGTWTLYQYLKNPKNKWKQVNEYEAECVVVAPTGMGKKGSVGHTWICMEDNTLASSNSYGINKGKFTKNYTPALAEKKYTGEYKMPLFIFKHI